MKIFVIMPFSKTTERHTKRYWDNMYNRIRKILTEQHIDYLKHLFKVNTIGVHRASAPQGNIVKSILNDLTESDIVIAILSDQNPNVLYELGIRHSLRPHTIMLSQESQKIPFDLNNYGVGLYADSKKKYTDIESELVKRLRQIAEDSSIIDNPYLENFPKSNSISMLDKPDLKIRLLSQKDVTYKTNSYYREMEKTSGGSRMYSGRTILTCSLEIFNYTKENITIINSQLVISSQTYQKETNRLFTQDFIESDRATAYIEPTHKKHVTIEPKGIYEARAAFILSDTIPEDLDQIEGHIIVTDINDREFISNSIKMRLYAG